MVTGKRRAHQNSEAVRPQIVHGGQHEERENSHKQQKATRFHPQVHEEQHCQSRLQHSEGQHAGKHLLAVNMLVGDSKLNACDEKYQNVNDQVFAQATMLDFVLLFSWIHKGVSAQILVRNIQQVDKRDHKHPDQVHEMPVEPENFDIVRVVASAFVAEADDD